MSRGRRQQQAIQCGPTTMFIVAGLPPSLHNRARSFLEQLSRVEVKVVVLPSTESDGPLYPERLVSSIVRAAGGFAVRRRRTNGPNNITAPSTIVLLYVPAPDHDLLLDRLGFAPFPVALHELSARDAAQRQLRHSFDAVKAALTKVVDTAGPIKRDLNHVRERVNRLADTEALLLPPRNFVFDHDRPVAILFQSFRRGEREWTDKLAELQPKAFTCETIPHLPPNHTRRTFQDLRDLVFFTAHPSAYDGKAREVAEGATEDELLARITGLYRFGAALPNGFHHDAQLEYKRDLNGIQLECATAGAVEVHGSHANIYANDFIRAADKRRRK